MRTIKPAFDPKFSLGGCAVGTHAVLDGNNAALVLAERRVNQAVAVAHVAVNDGEVFLLDGTGFPDFSKLAGDFGVFGDDDDAAGFPVETVDEMGWEDGWAIFAALRRAEGLILRRASAMEDRGRRSVQIKADAADEA